MCSQPAHSGCAASDGSAGDDTGVQLYDLHHPITYDVYMRVQR